ncbi:MAG: 3-oxoacyl-ACP synthase III family protein [Bdellovibrionales bacterium]
MAVSKIVSTGIYSPKKVVLNKDLEKMMDTSDEWIQQRSGIKERRWVSEGETTLSMAVAASKEAIEKANIEADDIDMIIFTSLMTDYIFPGTGVLLQRELGMKNTVPALDTRNQCTGFLYSLSVADAWIRSGMYKRVLICASEIHSTSMDKSTTGRDISVLFGDAAAACIVEASEDTNGPQILGHVLHSEGAYAEKLAMMKPSSNDLRGRINPELINDEDIFPNMDGRFVFKNAVTRMPEAIRQVCEEKDVALEDIDFVIAHQANLRINNMVLEQLKVPPSKTHNTLERYGNTTACTIPLTLDEAMRVNKIKEGDLVCFVAFGSGFTWGASLVRF